jgi:phosphoribosylpyrophosphate synthetase
MGKPLGDITVSQFADGEIQPSINESVRGTDVFFIQSTFPNADNLLELLLMIDAAKRASAHYITAVIPYFGMARQDQKRPSACFHWVQSSSRSVKSSWRQPCNDNGFARSADPGLF